MKKIAVFASGSGSNFQAIVDAVADGRLEADIALLVCDRPGAKVIERAERANVPTFVFSAKDYESKAAFESEIAEKLKAIGVDWIVLAGYMRLIGETLLSIYEGKIVNIHPSLLPAFPGKNAVQQALDAKVKVTGVTIHYVDEGMDTGPIIAQQAVTVDETDDHDCLLKKIQAIEHQLYPKTIAKLLEHREDLNVATKRALVSVSDKTGIIPFAQALTELGIEIISTGGTKKAFEEAGIPVTGISEVTKFPEILDGRVKTLHPNIHGGLLAVRGKEEHRKQLAEHQIQPIDLVVVNLYPFQETIANPDSTFADAIENIDIGGPSMLRSAAKNHQYVTVVVDPADYEPVLAELKEKGETTEQLRRQLAAKVFRHTAAYDAVIADYLTKQTGERFPEKLTFTFQKKLDLRYGENPHQQAAFYAKLLTGSDSLAAAKQWHGKALSYNNIQDANAALAIVREFTDPAVVAVKHMNPCGVGTGETILSAYRKAYEADPVSIFGGIVACNREIDAETAMNMKEIFLEIILAPSFSDEALHILKEKKNLRLLTLDVATHHPNDIQLTSVSGGLLVQTTDTFTLDDADMSIPTERKPTDEEWEALKLAWKVVKHVKSNAIVLAKKDRTVGIGAGQMNRVGSANIAIEQAGEEASGAVMGSDAFFPMPDTVEAAGKAGVRAIIQPGGSIRDQESIDKANEYGIAMVFTGIRHFKH